MGREMPEDAWSALAKQLGASEPGILFSLRDGFVWASWPGTTATVKLGRHEMVAGMMYDFLAQDAVARRLQTAHADRGNGQS
jgi:hypothetical protein